MLGTGREFTPRAVSRTYVQGLDGRENGSVCVFPHRFVYRHDPSMALQWKICVSLYGNE